MAGATGLEPATSGVTGRRSNQLSYAPAASIEAGTPSPAAGGCQASPGPNRTGVRGEKPALRHFDQFEPALNTLEPLVDAVEPTLHRCKIDLQRGKITMQASDITFDRTEAGNYFVELALHSIEAFVLSSEARSQEIENLGILGHYSLMRSRCRAVVGDDGLEPPTLSV